MYFLGAASVMVLGIVSKLGVKTLVMKTICLLQEVTSVLLANGVPAEKILKNF